MNRKGKNKIIINSTYVKIIKKKLKNKEEIKFKSQILFLFYRILLLSALILPRRLD